MSNACKITPDAPNGKPSKLFSDLMAHTRNREMAKRIWGFTKTKLFADEFTDLEKDENGEYTYEAVAEVLQLDRLLSPSEREMNKAIDMGRMDYNGKPTQFGLAKPALAMAEDFNRNTEHKIAVVPRNDNGKFATNIVDKTELNTARADRNEARAKLNDALLAIVERMGFNVEFAEDPGYAGIFDPLLAEENANGLKTVIRVANGEEGLEALPEEICHFIIAGLKKSELKTRLDAAFDNDMVKRVLGKRYDYYRRLYGDSQKTTVEDRVREEAEGKVLAATLKGQTIEDVIRENQQEPEKVIDNTRYRFTGITNLIRKIWNYAKSLFKKGDVTEIDNAIVNAKNATQDIRNLIESGEIDTILDREDIMAHEKMYELSNKLEKLADMAQDGETLLSKQLYILQHTDSNRDQKELRRTIAHVRDMISNQKYSSACYNVLYTIGQEVKTLMMEAEDLGRVYNNTTDLNTISAEAGLINRMEMALKGYVPYLSTLSSLNVLAKKGEIEMSEEWRIPIVEEANAFLDNLKTLERDLKKYRFAVLKQLITLYYGDMGKMPKNFKETDRVKWESVDMILRGAKQDIGWFDSKFFSAGDSRNPLLNVIHKIVVTHRAMRDNKINDYCMKMQNAEAKLHEAGYDNKFVYQMDENGKPTGYYVAPVDMARYEKDRIAYADSVNANDQIDYYETQRLIAKWEEDHTEEVEVGQAFEDGSRRIELLPKRSLYGVSNFQDGWSKEQKDYYEALINMKAEMDNGLPDPMRCVYAAPQVRKSVSQMFDKDGKGALGTIWSKWKSEFSIVDDNPDYGYEAKQKVLLDFKGDIIKRVPVYYINKLDDMRDLSTDATHAMFNYISMATNYSEMGRLANAMRMMQEHVRDDYEVQQTRGGKPMIDMFKAMGREYEREYVKVGEVTRVGEAINTYIDRQFFNETKKELGAIANPFNENKSISLDSMFNIFMRLTSVSRMGINVLSGITNATQGESQMLCEAVANRHFNLKDLLWSKKEYSKLLFDYIGNFNSSDRHDKMYMLINQFNSSEDFFRDMMDKDFNKSALKRVLGRGNVYFLNTAGEHYLHTSGMLMVLKHEKVKRLSNPNEVVSLYDCIKQVKTDDGWRLELDDDIEFVDRNRPFLGMFGFEDNEKPIVRKDERDPLFESLSLYINRVNADMHGGYSEAEKGNANRAAGWRLILQFRQWMFGMYNKMYSRPYYDAVSNSMKEGGYYSIYKFLVGTLHDLKNMSIKQAIENNRLTPEEKKNASVAWAQAALFAVLALMCRATKGWKDKDKRSIRLLAYSMRRLEMETGALVPFPPTFIKNIFTLIQSPAAGVKTLETLSELFDVINAFEEIQSGRYKGWKRGTKALYTITPIYNIQKVIDMEDYNYMFNIFG